MVLDKVTREIMTNKVDLKILRALLIKSYSLVELSREVGIAYKNLSPHVKKLEKAGWLKTWQDKNSRGKRVIVSSTRYDGTGDNWLDPSWRDLFKGKIGRRAQKEILEVVKDLNKKATLEAISYLTDMSVKNVWKNLLKGLLNSGYIQAKFELTEEGKNYLEELREDY